MTDSGSSEAFVIAQVGTPDSRERRWADEVYGFIIQPECQDAGLSSYRSDLDRTPGPIKPALVRRLLEARVVVADLTGRNPNVFYELGIAHAFGLRVVALVSTVTELPFDTNDERAITLGSSEARLSASDAARARVQLRESLCLVLRDDYEPKSVVTQVAGARSLDLLAPNDPVAAELALLREQIAQLRADLLPSQRPPATKVATIYEQLFQELQYAYSRLSQVELPPADRGKATRLQMALINLAADIRSYNDASLSPDFELIARASSTIAEATLLTSRPPKPSRETNAGTDAAARADAAPDAT